MNGIAILLTLSAVGVDYGWQPGPDGQLEYIVQIEPALFDEMRSGRREVASEIHPDARGVRRFRIRVGNGPLPRVGGTSATPTRQLDSSSSAGLTDQAAGGAFPYATPSPGVLNLPPPPAIIGPDGKASVLVRPGDNALPGASAVSDGGWQSGFSAPEGGVAPLNPADTSRGFSAPAQGAWDLSGPRVEPPAGRGSAAGASGILPPSSNAAPGDSGFGPSSGLPLSPVPGSQPETGLPSPIRSSGMNPPPKSSRSGVGNLLAGVQTRRPGSASARDVASGGAAAQKPTLDEETARKLQELAAERPWVPLVLTSLALFGSLAANAYLGWVAAGVYRRYRDMCDQLHEAQASLT